MTDVVPTSAGPLDGRGTPDEAGPVPLTSGQRRMWFVQQLAPDDPGYVMFVARRVRGVVLPDVLQAALDDLVARHQSLRTRIHVDDDGRPWQSFDPAARVVLQVTDLSDVPGPGRAARARGCVSGSANTPFDLTRDVLLRAVLVRLAPDDHVLALVMHHITSDGWSVGVLLPELSRLYDAHLHQHEDPLPPLPVSFAEYAMSRAGAPVDEAGRDYWLARLAGVPALTLPTDHPRPARRTSGGGSVRVRLGPDVAAAVRALARRCRCTPFMTLLAAFQVLLHRLSGQDDFAVGTPVAARTDPDLEALVGYLLNTVALRADLSGDPTFADLLARTRRTALGAYTHQDVPFEDVLDAVRPRGDVSGPGLFDVMFVLQTHEMAEVRLAGAALEAFEVDFPHAKVDLTCEVWPDGDSYEVNLEYSTHLWQRGTVEGLADAFVAVVTAVVASPQARISEVPTATEAARRRILDEFNRAPGPAPGDTVVDLIGAQVARTPQATAVSCGGERVTYRQLWERAGDVAAALSGRGVGPGSVVGLHAHRSVELVTALVGVLRAGAAYLPLDPEYPSGRREHMIKDAGVRLVLTDSPPDVDGLDASGGSGVAYLPLTPGRVVPRSTAALPPGPGPNDAAYVIYTSGSTGTPKGVPVQHSALAGRVAWMAENYAIGPRDQVLQFASLGFDTHAEEIFPTLAAGGRLVLATMPSRFLPDFLATADGQEITVLDLPTSFWTELVAHPDEVRWPSGLRLLILGADALTAGALARWRAHRPDVVVMNTYGPTEATIVATAATMSGRDTRRRPSIGRPLSGTTVSVRDGLGRHTGIGVPGELHIGGHGLAVGYLNLPDLTARRFRPDPDGAPGSRMYATGDRAVWRADGTLEHLGRLDHQVKLRGHRIEPGEVEAALLAHPGVQAAVVTVHREVGPDVSEAAHLAAYVVLHPEHAAEPARLRDHLRTTLPEPMVPTRWAVLDHLPLTANGKIDRAHLPTPRPLTTTPGGAAPPTTPAELLVARVWAEALHVPFDELRRDSDLFDLGGDSLTAARVAARLQRELGRPVPLGDVFGAPRLRGLAELIGDPAEVSARVPIPRRTEPLDRAPLAPAQQRLWFLAQLSPDGAYNLPVAARVRGAVSPQLLQAALDDVVARHQSLRIRVHVDDDGSPWQSFDPGTRIALQTLDLSDLPDAERLTRARGCISAQANTPFDLTRDPLLRAVLIRLTPTDHVVALVMHHITSDGWSVGILLTELSHLYAAHLHERPDPLPPLAVTYADYATARAAAPPDHRGRDYWLTQLAGTPPLTLPTDRPRPSPRTSHGDFVTDVLAPEDVSHLQTVARAHGCTPFMVLLASFQVLLRRLTGQEDFAVGTPVAARTDPDLEHVVGYFAQTLVLRGDLSGDPTFADLLARTRRTALGAYTHQDIPFEDVLNALGPRRDLSRAGLFDVLFALQNAPSEGLRLGGVPAEGFDQGFGHAKFDLTLEVWPRSDGGHEAVLGYNTDLFEAATAGRWLTQYLDVVRELIRSPQSRVGTGGGVPGRPRPAPAPASPDPAPAPAPGDPAVEHLIARVWTQVLDVPADRQTDFFAAGGHSLLALQAASRLNRALPPAAGRVSLVQLFQHPTPMALAGALAAATSPADDERRAERLLVDLGVPDAQADTAVVCLPYAGGSALAFEPLGRSAPAGLRVLGAVPRPGRPGRLPASARAQEVEDFARSVADEVARTVPQPVIVYGHSAGCAPALALARALEAAGRDVTGVVLAAAFPMATPPGTVWGTVARVLGQDRWAGDRVYARALRAAGVTPGALTDEELHDLVARTKADVESAEAWFTTALATDGGQVLTCPVVSLVGERDPQTEFYEERCQEWRAFARDVHLVVLDEAGHFFAAHRAKELGEILEAVGRGTLANHARADHGRDGTPGRTGRPSWWTVPDTARTSRRPEDARRFALVAAGQTLSLLGSALTEFAIPLAVLLDTGSLTRFGLLAALGVAPGLLVTPFAGALVDRYDRRRVMIAANGAALAVETAMAATLTRGQLNDWHLYALVAMLSAILPAQRLAYLAAVPQLVPKRYLTHANAVTQLAGGAGQLFVPLVAAGVFAGVGIGGILAIDIASYVACLVVLLLVRFPATLGFRPRESLTTEIRHGLRHALELPGLPAMFAFFAVLNLVLTPLLLLVSPLALTLGGLGSVATLTTAGAAGGLVSAAALTLWGGPPRAVRGILGATGAMALGAVVAGTRPTLVTAALGIAIVSAALVAMNTLYVTSIQTKVPERLHGRVFSIGLLLSWSTVPVGFAVVAPAASAAAGRALDGDDLVADALTWLVDGDRPPAVVFVLGGVLIAAVALIAGAGRSLERFDLVPDAEPDDAIAARLVRSRAGDAVLDEAARQIAHLPRSPYTPLGGPDDDRDPWT